MKTLTPLQLALTMCCCRLFTLLSEVRLGDSPALFMVSLAALGAVEAVLLIPCIGLIKKTGKAPLEFLYEKNTVAAQAVTVVFMGFFLWDCFLTSGGLAYYLDRFFSTDISRIAALFCAVAVAGYISSLSSSSVGKCAALAFGAFVIFMLLLGVNTVADADITGLHLAAEHPKESLAYNISSQLSQSRELVLFVFLLSDLKQGHRRSAALYIIIALCMAQGCICLAATALGDLASATDTPLYYLSCLSSSGIAERFDAGFMAVWTALGVLRLGIIIHCISRCVKRVFAPFSNSLAAKLLPFLPAVLSVPILYTRRWKMFVLFAQPPYIIVSIVGVVPLVLLAVSKRRREVED